MKKLTQEQEQRTNEIIANMIGLTLDEITPDKKLSEDLGFDDLDNIECIMNLEMEFDIKIMDDEADKIETVEQYHSYLATLINL